MLSLYACVGWFALVLVGAVYAQEFPTRPVRIVTSGVGGSTDFTARLVAQGIAGPLGQQVLVENRPGGAIQGEVVSKSPPDGYTLLIAGGTFWTFPLLQKAPYDPVRDFTPISLIEVSVNVVVVHPTVPAKSIRELVILARAHPGLLNYGSSGAGSTSHLAMEQFKSLSGVNIVHIPYKSNTIRSMPDLLAGEIQVGMPSTISAAEPVRSGKLRALAVTSREPSALAPGLPTVAASGVPGYEAIGMTGVFAPAKTPRPIINRLNQEIVRYVKSPDVRDTLFARGVETVGSTPEQLAIAMTEELGRLDKLIKQMKLRPPD